MDLFGGRYRITAPLGYVETGQAVVGFTVGPGNPQLAAGISAHAAGHDDKARDHFETALRQARALPHRLLLPTVQYWYGRTLCESADVADRARGPAMVDAALAEFRAFDMVMHAGLAEQFLRGR